MTPAHHEDAPARITLRYEPAGKSVRVPSGVSVFDAALWNGVAVDSTCGGHGTCRKCKVRIASDQTPIAQADERTFTAEQLADGWRLACLTTAHHDLVVDVPELTTRPKAATLADQRTDLQRVRDAVDDLVLDVDIEVLRSMGRDLRAANWSVTAVVVGTHLVALEPGDTTDRRFGIAIDLGTTTAVATLMDLSTGAPLAVSSMLNRQQPYGADVISRISATMLDPDALVRLRDLAQSTLADLTLDVLVEAGVKPDEVYEVALAGNATMTQLLLGIDPEPLGVAPFIPVSAHFEGLRAADLGVPIHPRARATVFPALGAYVGGDIVAGALAAGMDRDKRLRLFIDIGTNCEIILADGERLVCTA
ncbi:MAG: 2Fe-2S iron-sulfur cluster-binding protein, partial [Candidatus Nanopelagicales bacterium]